LKKRIKAFSVIAIIMMIVSPYIIFFVVKSDAQSIGFFASYLGGIFGGIVSGGLTLGGVYLTIQHQNKVLRLENAAKISYVFGKLNSRLKSMNTLVENKMKWDEISRAEDIRESARDMLKIIEAHMHIIYSDFTFLKVIEDIAMECENLLDIDYANKSGEITVEEYEEIHWNIQGLFEKLYDMGY
jgi:hypothetical protein